MKFYCLYFLFLIYLSFRRMSKDTGFLSIINNFKRLVFYKKRLLYNVRMDILPRF